MSRAGSSSAWITVTAKLLLLKSYSSYIKGREQRKENNEKNETGEKKKDKKCIRKLY